MKYQLVKPYPIDEFLLLGDPYHFEIVPGSCFYQKTEDAVKFCHSKTNHWVYTTRHESYRKKNCFPILAATEGARLYPNVPILPDYKEFLFTKEAEAKIPTMPGIDYPLLHAKRGGFVRGAKSRVEYQYTKAEVLKFIEKVISMKDKNEEFIMDKVLPLLDKRPLFIEVEELDDFKLDPEYSFLKPKFEDIPTIKLVEDHFSRKSCIIKNVLWK